MEPITKPVIVTAKEGVVIHQSKNPLFGYVRVEQTRNFYDKSGFADSKIVSALIPGKLKALEAHAYSEGMTLPGNVVFKDSMEPFNKSNPDKDLKIAGESGIVCTLGGKPIYRKYIYDPTGTEQDVEIENDNTEEIKKAFADLEEKSANKVDFEL